MSDREHDLEPLPGLPERPPRQERIIWQGAPHWKTVARRTFHVPVLAIYFALLVAWRFGHGLYQGEGFFGAIEATMLFVGLALAAIAVLLLLSWLTAKVTVYTITSERVVIRFGIAISMAVNLPFKLIRAAALKTYPDGTGDIPLELVEGERVSFIVMWPNVRPWSMGTAQPMLRGVANATAVGDLLARAMAGEVVTGPGSTLEAPARGPRESLHGRLAGMHQGTL